MSQPTESVSWFSKIFGLVQNSSNAQSTEQQPEQATEAVEASSIVSPVLKKRVDNAKSLIKSLSSAASSSNSNGGSPRSMVNKPVRQSPNSILQRLTTDTRKRQYTDNSLPQVVDDIFATKTAPKRFCGTSGNLSLIEEPININVPDRLDITWAGDSAVDPSPSSSIRSLKSRLSGAPSTTSSGLSSRTKAILQQLEKVHTPAKESRRLPIMRTATVTSERWNIASAPFITTNKSEQQQQMPAPPPLRKTRTAVPSRLQLLSTNLGFKKTPYWKDIYRPPSKDKEAARKKETNRNGSTFEPPDLNGSRLHPIFEMPERKKDEEKGGRQRQSMMKGTDGISRNIFNTKDLEDECERNPLPIPCQIVMPKFSPPKQGFMEDLAFTFELPKNRTISNGASSSVNKSFEEQKNSSSSSSSGSGDEIDTSSDSEESKKSEESSNTPDLDIPSETMKEKEPSKEEIKAPEVIAKAPASSTSWECPDCFVPNTADKCACCGHIKGSGGASSAPAAPKELVSNISSFFKETPKVSFGFGVSSSTASSTSTAASEKWTCQTCFIDNTGVKCAACSTPKEGSSTSQQQTTQLTSNLDKFKPKEGSTIIFGVDKKAGEKIEMPKPLFESIGVKFGMSTSSSSPNLLGQVKEVLPTTISSSEEKKEKPAENGSKITFGVPSIPVFGAKKEEDSSAKPLFGTPQPDKPLFGGSKPLFGQSSEQLKPLFGSSAPLFGEKPAGDVTKPLFGAAASTTEPPKITFGASTETSKPLFGTPSTTEPPKITFETDKPLFGTPSTAASDVPKPLFGSRETAKPLFGSSEAPKPLFGSTAEASKPRFSSSETAKPLFGAPEAPKPLFGIPDPLKIFFDGAPSTTTEPPKPISFGVPTITEASKPSFGQPSASKATPIFGQSTVATTQPSAPSPFSGFTTGSTASFGTASNAFSKPPEKKTMFEPPAAASIFGQGGTSSSNLFGSASDAPSATPLFGQPAAQPAPASTGFNFGAPTPTFGSTSSLTGSASTGSLFNANAPASTGFNFGAPATSSNQPFVFGSTPAPTNPPPFGQAAAPANPFAYQSSASSSSSNARKIVTARRRNVAGRR